jgi:hypothetical protein
MKTLDEKSVEKYWTKKVKKALVGKKIVGVEYLPKKYLEEWMWYKRPIVLKLDDGTMLIPQMDDEGNDGGAIWTSVDGLGVIPVI